MNELLFSDLAESNEVELLDLDFSSLFHAWTRYSSNKSELLTIVFVKK
jgi:hypothetical protein